MVINAIGFVPLQVFVNARGFCWFLQLDKRLQLSANSHIHQISAEPGSPALKNVTE